MYTLRLCTLPSLLILLLLTSPSASLKIFEDSLSSAYKLFYHRTGDFGPVSYNVTGELQSMQPSLGCDIDQYRNASDSYSQIYAEKVVLILRGNCTFSLKVFHAQQLGAVGVVIGDYNGSDSSNDFIVMSKDDDGNEVHVPAVFVPHNTYQWLAKVLFTDTKMENETETETEAATVYAMLDGDGEYVAPTNTMWLAAFGIVIIVIPTLWCAIVCLALLRKKMIRYAQGSRRRQHLTQIPIILYKGEQTKQTANVNGVAGKAQPTQKEDLHAKLVHIDADVESKEVSEGAESVSGSTVSRVSALLMRPFRGSRKSECAPHNSSCAVCLDDFQSGEELRLLPCEHAYHRHCIDPWLAKQSELCPMCKQSIFMNTRNGALRNGRACSMSLLTLCCCHMPSFAWNGGGADGDGNDGLAEVEEDVGAAGDGDGGQVIVLDSAQDELVRIDTDSDHSDSDGDLEENPQRM